MKKVLLAIITMVIIGMTSCKKEEGVQPDSKNNTSKVLNKKDTTQWD